MPGRAKADRRGGRPGQISGQVNAGGEEPPLRGIEAWSSPEWLGVATAWIDDVLSARGVERQGPAELTRVRHWGAVVRAPTSEGSVWLKAPADETLFELGIYEILAAAAPERIVSPLAIDRDRGWALLPDGGEPIGEALDGEGRIDAMAAALPRYAELQLALMPHVDELIAAGVDDMRAERMGERFEQAVAGIRSRFDADTPASDREGLDRVESERDSYRELCAQLQQAPVPASLDHNDLHHMNVLFGAGGDPAHARFYDWGDAVVAHPFSSLLALGLLRTDDRAALERLRDTYLEPFSSYGNHRELVHTVTLACRVGKVARALTWQRATAPIRPPDETPEYFRRAPLESLAAVLDDDWVGRF